tara:strand:- start:56 stop:211 length:156 start_codon:yes stop_codon:yes gene_type:complete
MNFDDYLTEYYGFNTTDGKWKRMSNLGKNLLRDSYKMDMSKAEDDTKVAKL